MEEKTEIEQQNVTEEQLQDVTGGALPTGAAGTWMAQQFAGATARTGAMAQRTGNTALAATAADRSQKLTGFFYSR